MKRRDEPATPPAAPKFEIVDPNDRVVEQSPLSRAVVQFAERMEARHAEPTIQDLDSQDSLNIFEAMLSEKEELSRALLSDSDVHVVEKHAVDIAIYAMYVARRYAKEAETHETTVEKLQDIVDAVDG